MIFILSIRPAVLEDSEAVLALRNDPDAVFWSGRRVSGEEHAAWFPTALGPLFLVLDNGRQAVGYGRVSPHGVVSYVVDVNLRGQGQGTRLLQALTEAAIQQQLTELVATTHVANAAAIRAFQKAGYTLGVYDRGWQQLRRAL